MNTKHFLLGLLSVTAPDHQLQKTITKYLIDEVGISEADIETFKSLLLEDI